MKEEIVKIFDLVPGDNSFKVTLSNGKSLRLVKNEEGNFEATFNLLDTDFANGLMMTDEEGAQFQIEVEEVESQNESQDIIQFLNFKIFEFTDKLTQNPSEAEVEHI